MAPNKFASMLHRNTNTLTLVLAYALLEWILIAAILLNSLFSYLILKYADYFGLKRPCVLCSRIDHGRDKRVRKDMICDEHALEISDLGFCTSHHKLVKRQQNHICPDCCCSVETSVVRIEEGSRCSCCDVILLSESVSPVVVEDRDLHFFGISGAGDAGLVAAEEEEAQEEQSTEQEKHEEAAAEEAEEDDEKRVVEAESEHEQLASVEAVVDGDDEPLTDPGLALVLETESRGFDGGVLVKMEEEVVESAADLSEEARADSSNGSEDESDSEFFENIDIEEHEEAENDKLAQAHTRSSNGVEDESDSEYFVKLEIEEQEAVPVAEYDPSEQAQTPINDETVDVKTEMEEQEDIKEAEINNEAREQTASAIKAAEDKTEADSNCNAELPRILETEDDDEDEVESKATSVDQNEQATVEKVAQRIELDGVLAVVNLSSEEASTVEKLKEALATETRALNEAYAELEQERSDSADAAAQTMAMITRLQEEKAALQMEASQYQRMMDELHEFDQEALLMLNEMVTRRERENQELEKELDSLRKRLAELEKMRKEDHQHQHSTMMITSESVSVSCSSFGDDQESDNEDDEHHHQSMDDERLSILNRLDELEQKLSELNEGDQLRPKQLQPLFDQVSDEEEIHEASEAFDCEAATSAKLRIEEEVRDVYEKLHVLEEEKEFLRNCMHSLKKGDEGMRLVQEILQHLRALRRME